MMEKRRPSIQDVARQAGVSAATVSRVLSKPDMVSEATRLAVIEAVNATGYTVNLAARNLRRQRTGNVVALVPKLANPFFSQIVSSISQVLASEGYSLLVSDTRGSPRAEERLMGYLDEGRADGLILFDGAIPPEHIDNARRGRPLPPTVMACEWIEGSHLPRIRIDNEHGAALAVEHLVGKGHVRIGHVSGPAGNVLTQAREAGLRAAMAERGLELRPEWMFCGDFTFASGASAAEQWLALSEAPTAIFCANDESAIGFIGAVQRAGKSVPGDVSVVGFDDIEIADHVTPRLTTIRQPRTAIGEVAAKTLLTLIDGGAIDCADQQLEIELVERASTAGPRTT